MKSWRFLRCKVLFLLLLFPTQGHGQVSIQAELVLTVGSDEPVLTAALSADGRLAYAIEKTVDYGQRRQRRVEVYAMLPDGGEKKRIIPDDYFRDSEDPNRVLHVTVERLEWSPDGSRLAVEVTAQGGTATFFFKSTGGALRIRGGGNVVSGYGARWLGDNGSLGILEEAVSPRLLHRVLVLRVEAGRTIPLFRPRTFAGVAWVPGRMQVVLVERDRDFADPPRLLVGDLASGGVSDLGPEPDYLGGLRAAPDGERFSYFAGQKKLVVRKLTGAVERTISIPFTRYEWLPTGGALAYLEPQGPGLRAGWLAVWNPQTQTSERLVPEERISDFWLAPDGSHVAILTAEEVPALKVYRLQVHIP